MAENFCNSLGDCIGECPEGAIAILEREATTYEEEAVQMVKLKPHECLLRRQESE